MSDDPLLPNGQTAVDRASLTGRFSYDEPRALATVIDDDGGQHTIPWIPSPLFELADGDRVQVAISAVGGVFMAMDITPEGFEL